MIDPSCSVQPKPPYPITALTTAPFEHGGPTRDTVGTEVYPLPPFVKVTEITTPFVSVRKVPLAPLPPPPLICIVPVVANDWNGQTTLAFEQFAPPLAMKRETTAPLRSIREIGTENVALFPTYGIFTDPVPIIVPKNGVDADDGT